MAEMIRLPCRHSPASVRNSRTEHHMAYDKSIVFARILRGELPCVHCPNGCARSMRNTSSMKATNRDRAGASARS